MASNLFPLIIIFSSQLIEKSLLGVLIFAVFNDNKFFSSNFKFSKFIRIFLSIKFIFFILNKSLFFSISKKTFALVFFDFL